mmetsp:Transcript_104073/g.294346  ORF Transcript_104073/g.294346 Transcript_104073/m.294346 type:complete len:81 (-) Transcript_104073:180-422(-)
MGSRVSSSCSNSCEPDDEEGEPTGREDLPMTPEERRRYETEFERHVQGALQAGAKEVFCEQCGARFVSRSGTATRCPPCR